MHEDLIKLGLENFIPRLYDPEYFARSTSLKVPRRDNAIENDEKAIYLSLYSYVNNMNDKWRVSSSSSLIYRSQLRNFNWLLT